MKTHSLRTVLFAAAIAAASSIVAHAQVFITEVAPWSSGSGVGLSADWFELTNKGSSAVNITGWTIDDNSNSFASSLALNGVTSIAAGESVIFIETGSGQTAAGNAANFKSLWFGATSPAGLQIGNYGGSGVGLGTTGDAVNIFNSSGVLQANVSFGASPAGPSFPTFENSALLNNATISQLSVLGTKGAFAAAGDSNEIGSPGVAIPEPATYALLFGCAALSFVALRRRFCVAI